MGGGPTRLFYYYYPWYGVLTQLLDDLGKPVFFFFLQPRQQPRSVRSDGDRQHNIIATSSAPLDGVTTQLRALKHRFSNLVSKLQCGF